jgi:hypothetical protein
MEAFFIARQVPNFEGKFIVNLNTHIMNSLLVFSHPTRCNYIFLAFISRTLHVSGIHHAHHQEYITASAVVGIT